MLILQGGSAESEFRLKKRLAALQGLSTSVRAISGSFIYLIDGPASLPPKTQYVLEDLLGADSTSFYQQLDRQDIQIFVVPRIGTITPWSSKASDIFRRCSVEGISRVERGIRWHIQCDSMLDKNSILHLMHDPMTESVLLHPSELETVFKMVSQRPLKHIDILTTQEGILDSLNQEFGFALSQDEINYLIDGYRELRRNPTDAELMMFAQVNSEHCRHKIFNANWVIDGNAYDKSLFNMIRSTQDGIDNGTLVAYSDNAAIISGKGDCWLFADPTDRAYRYVNEPVHIVAKVETHNHPTAISPFAGAATGAGGEIRDEAATGQGGISKAGITGFSVSNLNIPGWRQPWECEPLNSPRGASALQIMLDAPIGAATFNNEFGRPNIGGYFRTLEVIPDLLAPYSRRGYHKPIMLAGGLGNVRERHVEKKAIPGGAQLVVLGGPAMLIGLGGGAASSLDSGGSSLAVDFASVQRGNAEMQRRCQEVINSCIALGASNPILSIHDVGAGGLCNAFPELVESAGRGAIFDMNAIPSDDPGMSPMEIWCNEAQERYVIAIAPDRLPDFEEICAREKCPNKVVGNATQERKLVVTNLKQQENMVDRGLSSVDLDLDFLFGEAPQRIMEVFSGPISNNPVDLSMITLDEAIERVLRLPAVADKSFLITINDRSVGGRVVRDPLVGPWQTPVADVGVTSASFVGKAGEAIAIGERPPIALFNPVASGRIAVGEAITNILAAGIDSLSDIKISANWMAATDHEMDGYDLFMTVKGITDDLCKYLGVSIPVGKDSLSMATRWMESEVEHEVVAPISLIVTAFAPVSDITKTLTPELEMTTESVLLFVDLSLGKTRLGGSALSQVFNQLWSDTPDIDSPRLLKNFSVALYSLITEGHVLAYHDRSDGGLFTAIAEMAFAARCGVAIYLQSSEPISELFNEELGVVLQIDATSVDRTFKILESYNIDNCAHIIGKPSKTNQDISIYSRDRLIYRNTCKTLHQAWSETAWRLQSLRDHSTCAKNEYDSILDWNNPGLNAVCDSRLTRLSPPVSYLSLGARPLIAILREQGVNGHLEMAAAFDAAGFSSVDVTMSELKDGIRTLDEFSGLVACGGFSYGDVLGAGAGWAKSILNDPNLRDMFESFFTRLDTFSFGVCNGCQMLSMLKDLIPGTEHWPAFTGNFSERFEARVVMVEILDSASVLFPGLSGSRLPIVVAHGEGRVSFKDDSDHDYLSHHRKIVMRYIDNWGSATTDYPFNPNGSVVGVTGFCSRDGRSTIVMPHPERVYRTATCSWHPSEWGDYTPWLEVFTNARKFCD